MSDERNYMTGEQGAASIHQAASLMGQKGGPAAAKVRFSKMTAEQRKEHGRRLGAARWADKSDAERSAYGRMMAEAKKAKRCGTPQEEKTR